MFDGYLSLGSNELMNVARTTAYVRRFLPTLDLRGCADCEWLDRITATKTDWHGAAVFDAPDTDDAPWFDVDDPDSANFYGLYPVTITGIEDATRTATVTQSINDGGFVTDMRSSTKEILVTALMVGRDEAAMSSAMSWLRVALDGSMCDPCTGDDLCFLAACPKIDPTQVFDPDGALVSEAIPLADLSTDNGTWDGSLFSPNTATSQLLAPIPDGYSVGDQITYEWAVDHTVTVQVMDGLEVVSEATGTGTVTVSGPMDRYTDLHCRLSVPDAADVTVSSVTASYHPKADAYALGAHLDPQVDPYRRTLRQVTCISGPTVVEKYAIGIGTMQRVEFILTAGVPYLYGEERPVSSTLISQVTTDTAQPIYQSSVVPLCVVTPDPQGNLIRDPDCPTIPNPPRPPSIVEASCGGPEPTLSYVVRVAERLVPVWYDSVPVLTLRTGHNAAREVRVRMFPRPLPQALPEDLDLCSACMSFIVTYIPQNATLTLDGMIQRAVLERSGDRRDMVNHLLRGIDDAVFDWPALTCGMGYYAVIDTVPGALVEVGMSLVTRK